MQVCAQASMYVLFIDCSIIYKNPSYIAYNVEQKTNSNISGCDRMYSGRNVGGGGGGGEGAYVHPNDIYF